MRAYIRVRLPACLLPAARYDTTAPKLDIHPPLPNNPLPTHTASLAQLLSHLAGLRFEDTPDYDLCLRLLDAMAPPGQEDLGALPPAAFDWLGAGGESGGGGDGEGSSGTTSTSTAAVSGYQRAKAEEAGLDAGARQLLLSKQVLALCEMDGSGGAGSSTSSPGASDGGGGGRRDSLGFFKGASPPPPPPKPKAAGLGSSGSGGDLGSGLPEIDLARMWARVGRRLVEQEEEDGVRACVRALWGGGWWG